MAGKRKRAHPERAVHEAATKKQKVRRAQCTTVPVLSLQHPVLSLYYPFVCTLRNYIISKLPKHAKSRRRRLAPYRPGRGTIASEGPAEDESDVALSNLLDTTIVGCRESLSVSVDEGETRSKDFIEYSQLVTSTAGGSSSSLGQGSVAQSELVDFAIWSLFHTKYRTVQKPPHLLCHGYQRAGMPQATYEDRSACAGIHGLVSLYPNSHVSVIKGPVWMQLLRLMGSGGDKIMLDLMLDCGMFMAVEAGRDNFYQLSGTPLPDVPVILISSSKSRPQLLDPQQAPPFPVLHTPSSIWFVRSRMMYTRAALNRKGEVRFGMRHIHVLNRYPDHTDPEHTAHVMKYIFPRQFGLHNVFTSVVDKRETSHPFMDYTLREQEILAWSNRQRGTRVGLGSKIPKRLRGAGIALVQELQRRHSRCAYVELLKHYCPVTAIDGPRGRRSRKRGARHSGTALFEERFNGKFKFHDPNTPAGRCLVDAATPLQQVSAFCRAVLASIIPHGLLGSGNEGLENRKSLMDSVDLFVRCKRFDNINLHAVFQNIKVRYISWLSAPQTIPRDKLAMSDFEKRQEILLELLYYVFDSILIPLLRSNFHITESNDHKYRLFFFRHDIWRTLTETSLTNIKLSMFQEMPTDEAIRILDSRTLGFSRIRLLPKGSATRPIMNLRRRAMIMKRGKAVLGTSVNTSMKNVFGMLNYEKSKQPSLLGSSMFSVGELHPRLRAFRADLLDSTSKHKPMYFVKVDVQSCFDTIPQDRMINLIERICSEKEYRTSYHAEIRPGHVQGHGAAGNVKPSRKFLAKTRSVKGSIAFQDLVQQEYAVGRKGTVFVSSAIQVVRDKDKLIDLLREHVRQNIVRIGKKFYRQRQGIPQGSVVSSLLCSFFYAEFERTYLDFLKQDESQLVRMIDDFLLITTNKAHAERFLHVMLSGKETYGIKVKAEKTLINFECSINAMEIRCMEKGSTLFPYCGTTIDTKTLEVTKAREEKSSSMLADAMTVERAKQPGKAFHRKMMNALRINMQAMYTDMSLNSPKTVLKSMYGNFVGTAQKAHRYLKCLQRSTRLDVSVVITTISDLASLGYVLAKSKGLVAGYDCTVSKAEMQWLAARAFRRVLKTKQTRYGAVLDWLDGWSRGLEMGRLLDA